MNERIRELLLEVGFVGYGEDLGSYNIPVPAFNSRMEKFAELIVQECSQFVEDKFDFCGDELIIAEQILKHFGVEN